MSFILTMLFVYVPAMVFYLFVGVCVYAYFKKYGFRKKKLKDNENENTSDDNSEDVAYEKK